MFKIKFPTKINTIGASVDELLDFNQTGNIDTSNIIVILKNVKTIADEIKLKNVNRLSDAIKQLSKFNYAYYYDHIRIMSMVIELANEPESKKDYQYLLNYITSFDFREDVFEITDTPNITIELPELKNDVEIDDLLLILIQQLNYSNMLKVARYILRISN